MSDTCISRAEKEENVESQREELEALEAIYGDDFEVLVSAGDATNERNMCGRFPEIRLRISESPLVSLRLMLPEGYPSRDFPIHDIIAPGLAQAARHELSQALRPSRAHEQEEPGDDFTPSPGGAVVVFDWAETLRDILSQTYKNRNITPGQSDPGSSSLSSSSLPLPPPAPNPAHNEESRAETRYHRNDGDKSLATEDVGDSWKGSRRSNSAGSTTGRGVEGGDVGGEAEGFVEIVHGEPFTDRKSTFQAHLARVTSELQVTWVRNRLMENSKIARATHNIAAWRVWDESRGVQLHDNDDDGENAAGSRLAHMLAITGAQNILVVVSRWFGGIHLGPDRFKHINNAARELLVKCGATSDGGDSSSSLNTNSASGGSDKSKGSRRRRG